MVETLSSSSAGNCYIIITSKEVLILEAGVQAKKVLHSLKFKISNVAGALITHEHGDHSKYAAEIAKKGIDVYASAGTLEALSLSGHRFISLEPRKQRRIGNFVVMPFDIQHDAREPLGFLIYHPEFGKLLFATDTYYIKYRFRGLNYIMIECNYSSVILKRNIMKGSIHPSLRKRIIKSHFSLENVTKFLKASDISELRKVYLMHLSDSNSDEKLFKKEIESTAGVPVVVC